jgi:hypothetical protein
MVRTEELHVGPIKLSDAIRFFEAKGVSRTCPSCGQETCDLVDEARADVQFALPGFKFDVQRERKAPRP